MNATQKIVIAQAGVFLLAMFLMATYYRHLAEQRDGQLRKLVARELMAVTDAQS